MAESEDILAELIADLERCRLVGERKNAKLLYLAMISRLLEKIVNVVVKGPSSGGKSHLVKLVASFFPESAFCRFTAMSERTLLYTEEPLSHRHLIFSEAAGIGSDFQAYIIRTLLSECFLEYEFVEKTPEGLKPRRIRKEGPTGFITTTTRVGLNGENEPILRSSRLALRVTSSFCGAHDAPTTSTSSNNKNRRISTPPLRLHSTLLHHDPPSPLDSRIASERRDLSASLVWVCAASWIRTS